MLKISRSEKINLLKKYNEIELWNIEKIKNDISERNIKEMSNILNKKQAEKIYKIMISNNIEIIKYNEMNYPNSLKNISNFPIYLYIKGNVENLFYNNSTIGIVGARNASEYGKNMSRKFAYELSKKNICIVSGLAIGIDKQAHLGALDYKYGKTIAVLATSLLEKEIYPLENLKVFQRILEQNGTIISEYPIESNLEKYKFIERNRIISGLADKIIVIEASEKSGSLITADFALEQGKEVFVIPGNINLKNFVGSNNLIKEGAYLLNNINDLFH